MEEKKLRVISADNIRRLVNQANELGITNSEIITILKEPEQYLLIYYGD